MNRRISILTEPEKISLEWDSLAINYFQKRKFISYLHQYNYCNQRYYELYRGQKLYACGVVYSLIIDLFTFSKYKFPVEMKVIGLPVSVSSSGIFGNSAEFEFLITHILQKENGLILGVNFQRDYSKNVVINMRTLPTIIFQNEFTCWENYIYSLRSDYRRRIKLVQNKFHNITAESAYCSAFTYRHYDQYLQILQRTDAKLEILSLNFFKYLPKEFKLASFYCLSKLICWNIVCIDKDQLFFFFGGIDYSLRDQYSSYHNNLIEILKLAINNNYKYVDLGQTAEVAKTRLGGVSQEKRMFLYNKKRFPFYAIKSVRKLISYSKSAPNSAVFHKYQNKKMVEIL